MGLRIKRLRRALPLALLALAASACQLGRPPQPTAQQRAEQLRAERNRLDLERCERDRDQLNRQLAELRYTQRELARVQAETYGPAPRPRPMDPALAARFSLADQELDSIRHQHALASWREEESRRYSEWLQSHTSLQRRLEEQERSQLDGLRKRNSSLFDPQEPRRLAAAAVEKYSSCNPALFDIRPARPTPAR